MRMLRTAATLFFLISSGIALSSNVGKPDSLSHRDIKRLQTVALAYETQLAASLKQEPVLRMLSDYLLDLEATQFDRSISSLDKSVEKQRAEAEMKGKTASIEGNIALERPLAQLIFYHELKRGKLAKLLTEGKPQAIGLYLEAFRRDGVGERVREAVRDEAIAFLKVIRPYFKASSDPVKP